MQPRQFWVATARSKSDRCISAVYSMPKKKFRWQRQCRTLWDSFRASFTTVTGEWNDLRSSWGKVCIAFPRRQGWVITRLKSIKSIDKKDEEKAWRQNYRHRTCERVTDFIFHEKYFNRLWSRIKIAAFWRAWTSISKEGFLRTESPRKFSELSCWLLQFAFAKQLQIITW